MKKKSSLIIIISIIIAIILGLYFQSFVNNISFIGTIYINLLKFMIFPIIFTSIIVTIHNSKKNNNKLLIKTVLLFILMFVISFLLTSLIVYLINPTKGYSFNNIAWTGEITKINYSEVLVNLFPSSISNNSLFFIIILAIFIGSVASKVENGESVIKVVDGIKNIFFKILEYIMYLTPLAIIALLGSSIANYGNMIFDVGGKYILMAYLCSVIIMLLVMILPVWLIGGINPITYVKKIVKVWLMTISTCSSAATLPTTIKVCNDELKIPSRITNITVPLGCTIHMCGGAVSFALLGIFCSQLYGIDITITKYIMMLFSATVINMAAPGIPNGGIVIGASYLSLFGIPLSFMGFYSSIYKLLDMSYTTLNVTGDITANVILNKTIKK